MLRKRNNQQNELLTLLKLENEADFKSNGVSLFDCGDNDLNEFFREDAWNYKCNLLAESYLCYPTELFNAGLLKPIACISLCNDCIQITRKQREGELKGFYRNAIKKGVPYRKRHLQSFPAVKIARLGVQKEYCRGGIGTQLLNMVKTMFLNDNRTGCRFITVDAYSNKATLNFYKNKNQFEFLWEKDSDEDTRIMWFDLKNYQSA